MNGSRGALVCVAAVALAGVAAAALVGALYLHALREQAQARAREEALFVSTRELDARLAEALQRISELQDALNREKARSESEERKRAVDGAVDESASPRTADTRRGELGPVDRARAVARIKETGENLLSMSPDELAELLGTAELDASARAGIEEFQKELAEAREIIQKEHNAEVDKIVDELVRSGEYLSRDEYEELLRSEPAEVGGRIIVHKKVEGQMAAILIDQDNKYAHLGEYSWARKELRDEFLAEVYDPLNRRKDA